MPLGIEVGLGPGDFVLDGELATPLSLPKGGGSPPQKKKKFRPMFIVAKRLDGSSYCDFVRTLHRRYWFVQVQVQVLVFYAVYF